MLSVAHTKFHTCHTPQPKELLTKIGVSKLFSIEKTICWQQDRNCTVKQFYLFALLARSIETGFDQSCLLITNIRSSSHVYAFVFYFFFLFVLFIYSFLFTLCLIKQWFVYLFIHSIHFVSQNFVINIENESLSASFFHRTWFTADLGVKDAT